MTFKSSGSRDAGRFKYLIFNASSSVCIILLHLVKDSPQNVSTFTLFYLLFISFKQTSCSLNVWAQISWLSPHIVISDQNCFLRYQQPVDSDRKTAFFLRCEVEDNSRAGPERWLLNKNALQLAIDLQSHSHIPPSSLWVCFNRGNRHFRSNTEGWESFDFFQDVFSSRSEPKTWI